MLIMSLSSTAFSQITGLSLYQKKQIAKGLTAEKLYKIELEKSFETIEQYKKLVLAEKDKTKAAEDMYEGAGLQVLGTKVLLDNEKAKNIQLTTENKNLKIGNWVWKGIAVGGVLLTAYITTR